MNYDKFIQSQKVLRLATVDSQGRLHVVPVWYIYESGLFRIGTSLDSKKAKNIRETGKAAFCIDEGVHSPITGVAGSTAARLIEGPQVREMAEDILRRYFTSINEKPAQELLADTDCIIELEPHSYSSWTY